MPNNQFIGRRVPVGLGLESTPGTEVAPTDWIRQTKLGFQRKSTTVQNDSAVGRNEKVSDSATVEQWAEGNLEGYVGDLTIGYLLYNMFGSVTTANNADVSNSVKDHTFSVAQTQVTKTLTVVRKDPLTTRRHGFATIEQLDITGAAGEYVKFTASLKAKAGVTSSDSAAYATTENGFTAKHVTVKLASNTAGLTGATALGVKSFKLTLKRSVDAYFVAGSLDPAAFNTGAWEASGEMVLMYADTTLESTWFANTQQAMSLAIKNTDVTIGTAANPALTFTAPKVRLNTFSMSDDMDNVVEQTVGFYCELDLTSGNAIQALLTNLSTAY